MQEIFSPMGRAYFEDFSGISPLLDAKLPNEPDGKNWNPDGSNYKISVGTNILDHNKKVFKEMGLRLNLSHVPAITKDMLGLTDSETARIIGVSEEVLLNHPDQILAQTLEDRFFVAKFLHDSVKPELVVGDFPDVIRTSVAKFNNRTIIEAVGDGDGAFIVGNYYRLFDWSVTD